MSLRSWQRISSYGVSQGSAACLSTWGLRRSIYILTDEANLLDSFCTQLSRKRYINTSSISCNRPNRLAAKQDANFNLNKSGSSQKTRGGRHSKSSTDNSTGNSSTTSEPHGRENGLQMNLDRLLRPNASGNKNGSSHGLDSGVQNKMDLASRTKPETTILSKSKGVLVTLDNPITEVKSESFEKTTEKPLDPKVISSGLQEADRDPVADLERLLTFMSDDNVFPSHYKWKPSTRDRVKANGERVWKEDFEIESLLPFSQFRYSQQPTLGSGNEGKKDDIKYIEQEDIDDLDKTLKAARSARIRSDNEQFRQEKAFKYSSAVYHSANPRTLERGNFFTPVYVDSFWSPRSKDKIDLVKEYIILTPNQKVIQTHRMPFNTERSPQDMFSILSQLSHPEKYIKAITRLEKQGWSIIGGGGKGELVVFERQYNKKTRSTRYIVKLACGLAASVSSVVIILLALTEMPTKEVSPSQ